MKGVHLAMKASSTARALLLITAIGLVTLVSGCQYILPAEEEPLAPPLIEPKEVDYKTVNVERGDMVSSVQGMGRFESASMADVHFTASGGRIKNKAAKVGDKVKKGDVLIELDVGDLEYSLQRERLRLQQMENNYASLKKAMRYASDKTALTNAGIDLEMQKLTIQQLEEQKTNATLLAPFDGVVLYVTSANQGTWVDAYATLVRVADQSEKVLTYSNESNRASFQIGMKVDVTLKDKSTVTGEVISAPFDRGMLDTEELAKIVYIKLPDSALAKVSVGEEAKVVLVLAERKGVLKLPRNVIRNYQQRKYVQVLDVDDKVKVERDVEVGLETTTEAEILSGLEEGEQVIVK